MMTPDAPIPPDDRQPLHAGSMTFEELARTIETHKPPADPFNEATRVFLSADTYAAIVPHLHPFDRRRIAFEQRAMPPGYGVGFRPTREGDDASLVVDGYGTVVFTLAPKSIT